MNARASAGKLVARDLAARRLLSEAEALDRVLEREKNARRSGPVAEGILRDIGTVASRIG